MWVVSRKRKEKLRGNSALIPLYLLPSIWYPKCMYVCILQRMLRVFSFLHFAWHLHWTRPCRWFLIWELNTNPQLSILANVISCWIKKQCFCWGEGLNHRSCLLQLLDTKPRDVLLEETVPSRLMRKNCPTAFPMLGYTGGLYHTDVYTCMHTHKLERVEYNFCSCQCRSLSQ